MGNIGNLKECFSINGRAYQGIINSGSITVAGKSSDLSDIFDIYRRGTDVVLQFEYRACLIRISKIEKQVVSEGKTVLTFRYK